MGKRELVALINLPSWCLVMDEWFFLAVPWGCLRLVIVAFPDHTHTDGSTVSHFSYAPIFQGPHFLAKMLESNILYDHLFIDILSL